MIVEGDIFGYRLPVSLSGSNVDGLASHRSGWMLRLVDGDGRVGFGDCAPWPGRSRDCHDWEGTLTRAVQHFIFGHEFDSPAMIALVCAGIAGDVAPEVAAAIELGLLDLLGQRRGVSIAGVLSETPAESVGIAAFVNGPLEAEHAVAEGYQSLKLKLGGATLSEDTAQLRRIRGAIDDTIKLRVDLNGRYTADEAVNALTQWQEFSLEFVEQPVATPEEFRALRRTRVPIAADESVCSPIDRGAVLAGGLCDVVVLKPTFLGGLLAAQRVASWAQVNGMAPMVSCAWESAIGRFGAAHLAAAIDGPFDTGLSSPIAPSDDVVPLACADGRLHVGAAEGLGISPIAAQAQAGAA